MPGQWNPNALPTRPGAYFNFLAQPAVSVPPATGAIIAVPFTHSWGPAGTVVPMPDFSRFTAVFGNDLASKGYRAVRGAFTGEGVRGRRGAGVVLGYRLVGSSGAVATVTLQNTTPAAALRVDAVYKGTVGNGLRVSIRTNSVDGTKKDLVVLDGSIEVESFTYDPAASTPLATLAAKVNASSNWVRLTVLIDTVALATVTGVALASGNDGTTLVSGDWTATMSAYDTQRFGYFAPFDLTDPSIVASIKAWAKNANAKGRRFSTGFGGALNEDVGDAVDRAASLNDPDFFTIGIGSIKDNVMVDANGDPVVMSTSEFVPRLAGILSALGETRSLSGARVGGVELVVGPNEAEIDQAYDAGVIVLSTDSDPDAPVHIEKGLTTYTTKADPDRPYDIFKNPKYVRTMHDLQTDITEWVQTNVIGQLAVNAKSRSAVVAQMNTFLQQREIAAAIQPGWRVGIAADPPPTDDDEFIALDFAIAFGRSVEQVLASITIR